MKSIIFFLKILVLIAVALIVLRFVASAQQSPAPDMPIDAATRASVIDNIASALNDGYVFAEVAKKMEADIKARHAAKEYDSLITAQTFAAKVTSDLQAVSKDKHIRLRFSAEKITPGQQRGEPSAEEKALDLWYNRRTNFGFGKVERLDGNIGYIDLLGFNGHEGTAETVAAAMNFIANTDALIIDLRRNGGGSPRAVALISSYLFGDKPVHLNSLYWRKGDKTDDFWTTPTVAGKKFGNKDVYILTSKRTFSAAEEFSYNLKNLKRVTIIGETTGGGAHPGGMERVGDHFRLFVPEGRAINPISKTNWEGTGVEPDVKAPKEHALKIAYLTALTKSSETIKDPNVKAGMKELIDQTQKELDELKKVVKAN